MSPQDISFWMMFFTAVMAIGTFCSLGYNWHITKKDRETNLKNNLLNLKYDKMVNTLYKLDNFLYRYSTLKPEIELIKDIDGGRRNSINYNSYMVGKFLTLKSYKDYRTFLPKNFTEKIDTLYDILNGNINVTYRKNQAYEDIIEFDVEKQKNNPLYYHNHRFCCYVKDMKYFNKLAKDTKIFAEKFANWSCNISEDNISEIEELFSFFINYLEENSYDEIIREDINL